MIISRKLLNECREELVESVVYREENCIDCQSDPDSPHCPCDGYQDDPKCFMREDFDCAIHTIYEAFDYIARYLC